MADPNRQNPDPNDDTVRGGRADEQIRGVGEDDEEFDDNEDDDEDEEDDNEEGTL